MTVEMELTRKKSTVSKRRKGEGKAKGSDGLQFAKCTSGISVCWVEAQTLPRIVLSLLM
jgi:hypothetical protein